ncbi:Bifunctional nicotinamidase/pyrazinamidase [Cupriavidus sp. H19C3]|uniref:bifunctional nicotinamidase/pyrazinamidase n=1 Tax=Cupriavidus sp. H19C3 TaxID=3241603 RepID=UPI003BF83655
MHSDAQDCLLVVDVQYDFMPGGALAVPHGDDVVSVINRLAPAFGHVVLTQDWHPAGHASFASNHPGARPFETRTLAYGEQVMWPDHCVQETHGAALHAGLRVPHARLTLRKGHHAGVDSYSAFLEADRITPTGLAGYLREHGVRRIYLAGLATDFCVAWSALDARAAGFDAVVIEDACRAIDLDGSLAAAWRDLEAAGVARMTCAQVLDQRLATRSSR